MLRYLYLVCFLLSFTACSNIDWEVKEMNGTSISIDTSMPADSNIELLIANYKVQLDTIMNEVLCYTKKPVTHYSPESPLGNLVADLSFEMASANGFAPDMCLLNHYGLRAELPQGDITRSTAYELMPFENELVLIDLGPKAMQSMFDYLKKSTGHPIANLRLKFSDREDQIKIAGEDWNKKEYYRILSTDYLSKGGDRMNFFKQGKITPTGVKLRDAIINYMNKQDTLRTATDGRFAIENKTEVQTLQ